MTNTTEKPRLETGTKVRYELKECVDDPIRVGYVLDFDTDDYIADLWDEELGFVTVGVTSILRIIID